MCCALVEHQLHLNPGKLLSEFCFHRKLSNKTVTETLSLSVIHCPILKKKH